MPSKGRELSGPVCARTVEGVYGYSRVFDGEVSDQSGDELEGRKGKEQSRKRRRYSRSSLVRLALLPRLRLLPLLCILPLHHHQRARENERKIEEQKERMAKNQSEQETVESGKRGGRRVYRSVPLLHS